ncbi:sel1 repeat family protein [Herbaspirillum sp. LeCh32-8]|uniref:tetratricopeptide repeat protein n=1 Tax=Herbaspirillum sp. LeCh32-8 TaxID=2821356 RepID=UPI001AE50B19|nr:SEL1-like repeat protein [Herbaspirillum sp. LeCh32-8]MBP0600351.1 sel1 repeat family protein [Herbaspirillum sp. LeCh32-8]
MANREDLAIIRAARAGQADAQLTLGKRYLFGGNGLPQSLGTAFHWLERAARQGLADAWMLIAQHIPYEVVMPLAKPHEAAQWYERAFDAGLSKAGLVFARLVLGNVAQISAELKKKAIRALEVVAREGNPDAQWLLAQQGRQTDPAQPPAASALAQDVQSQEPVPAAQEDIQQWTRKAADAGIEQAQHALADTAWRQGDMEGFCQRAQPLAQSLLRQYAALLAQLNAPADTLASSLGSQNIVLLRRLAEVLLGERKPDLSYIQQLLELAALAGDRDAQLALGLLYGRMDEAGARRFAGQGSANYKKAIRWLLLAGEQGMAAGWYALSRIYLKPEFSQRNLVDVQHYLERAAEMGHVAAQLECGVSAWRNRRDDPSNDVRALYWLQKAAVQGNADAGALLDKVADRPQPAEWAVQARGQLTRELVNAYPFLAARIELATLFGLSRPEALLLDLKQADCGHCLVVDIRAQYARSKRRLIMVETGEERGALNRIGRLFEDVDCGPAGPEGNYRQRLYRLKTALPDQAGAPEDVEERQVEA